MKVKFSQLQAFYQCENVLAYYNMTAKFTYFNSFILKIKSPGSPSICGSPEEYSRRLTRETLTIRSYLSIICFHYDTLLYRTNTRYISKLRLSNNQTTNLITVRNMMGIYVGYFITESSKKGL